MRLEKVNENQIRCILTKEDLDMRQLKISEIAYGSAKAKMLFKDVMQQASYEFGFESDNIPLMINSFKASAPTISICAVAEALSGILGMFPGVARLPSRS